MKQEREKYIKEKIIMNHGMLEFKQSSEIFVPNPHFRMGEVCSRCHVRSQSIITMWMPTW